MHVHIVLSHPYVYMHACPDARTCRLCAHRPRPLPPPPASLRGFACWVKLCSVKKQKKKKKAISHIFTIFYSLPCPCQLRVCVCVCHHVSNVHQCMILFPATNATGRQQGSFQSSLKSPFSILGAPNLDVNAVGDRKASFTLTCGCITWMSKKREMIGSETSPRLKSLTMSLFQPRTHTPFLTGQFSNVEVQLRGWSHTQCII